MKICTHTIELGSIKKSFKSEKALDDFLNQYYHILSAERTPSDLEYSKMAKGTPLTPAETTFYKLEKASESIPALTVTYKDGVKRVSHGNAMSVTRAIENRAKTVPNSRLIYFNEANYRENRFNQLSDILKGPKPLTDPLVKDIKEDYLTLEVQLKNGEITDKTFNVEFKKLINSFIEQEIANWEQLGLFGTALHKMSEMYFKHNLTSTNSTFTTDDFKGLTHGVHEGGRRSYLRYLESLDDFLRDQHGDDAIIIPEYKIFDKNSKLIGVIDLAVIGTDGVIHIYDFKTSYKDPVKWINAKRLTHTYQLGLYRNMLQNQGFSVGLLGVLPIVMENINFEKQTIDSIRPENVEYIGYERFEPWVISNINDICPQNHATFYESSEKTKGVAEQLKQAWGYNVALKRSLSNVEAFKKKFVSVDRNNPDMLTFKDVTNETMIKVAKEKIDEAIEAYFKRESDNAASHLVNFKTHLKNIIAGTSTVDDFNYTGKKRVFTEATRRAIQRAFGKYFDGNWDIVTNDAGLDELGIIMFISKDGRSAEFASYTVNDLDALVELNLGKSVLGNFVGDQIVETDPRLLAASNGNLELLKVMFYLNANFKGKYNVGRVIAFNKNTLDFHTEQLDRLKYNFESIAHKLKIDNGIVGMKEASKYDILLARFNAILKTPDDAGFSKASISRFATCMADKHGRDRLKALQEIHKELSRTLATDSYDNVTNFDSPTKKIYGMVQEALAAEYKQPLVFENDIYQWTINSKNFSDPNNMNSKVIKAITTLSATAMFKIRQRCYKEMAKNKAITETFLGEQGYGAYRRTTIGDQLKSYSNLFVQDETTGKKHPSLILKDPWDPNSSLNTQERTYLTHFLTQINLLRYGTSDRNSEIAIEKIASGEWYHLPLLRGSAISQSMHRSTRAAMKEYWNTLLDVDNLFDIEKQEVNKLLSEGMFEMINTFDIQLQDSQRKVFLDTENIGAFEMDLEVILDQYNFAVIRKQEYDEILPIIDALKIATAWQAYELNIDIPNIQSAIDNYVMNAIYSRPNYLNESQMALKTVKVIKDVATFGNMAGNPMTGLVNLFQGQWANLTRVMAKTYGKNMYTMSEYRKAFSIVLKDSMSSISALNVVESLNMLYGINNMDMNRLPERLRINRAGLLSLRSGNLYWTSSAPDYFNRMIIFVAQMIHDGCYDAHVMKDGEMIYDYSKDTRFTAFSSNLTSDPDYGKQKALYKIMREEFISEGFEVPMGDPLPFAYTGKQRESLKDFSDSIHGHYDHQTKIQANHTILGILFFQFKTWMVAKKNQYLLQSGVGKQGDFEQVVSNGVKQWVDSDGNITSEDTGEPLLFWNGRVMEGIFVSFASMFKELRDSSKKWETFTHLLVDRPTRAANLRLFLWDLGVLLAIALLYLLFDMKQFKEDNPVVGTVFDAGRKASWDLNIFTVTAGAFSATPFASVSYVTDLFKGVWKVMGGDYNALVFVSENFGMLRPLAPLVKEAVK